MGGDGFTRFLVIPHPVCEMFEPVFPIARVHHFEDITIPCREEEDILQ